MRTGKLGRIARIQQLRPLSDQPEQCLDAEWLKRTFEGLVERWVLLGVEHCVVNKVRGSIRLLGRHDADELLLAHRLKRVVVSPLGADRGERVVAQLLAA